MDLDHAEDNSTVPNDIVGNAVVLPSIGNAFMLDTFYHALVPEEQAMCKVLGVCEEPRRHTLGGVQLSCR